MTQAAPEKAGTSQRGLPGVQVLDCVSLCWRGLLRSLEHPLPLGAMPSPRLGKTKFRRAAAAKKMQQSQVPGQTYQCQDAVGMFLQGPGLIIRVLPKQTPMLMILPIDKSFCFPLGIPDVCPLVLASKTVSPGISPAPKETPHLQECSEPDFPPHTVRTNTWLD